MIYIYLRLFFSIIILSCCMGMYAQNKISGEIVDRSNSPIPGVLISFNNNSIRTTSNMSGKFILNYSDTVKNRRIYFEAFGYKNKSVIFNKTKLKSA